MANTQGFLAFIDRLTKVFGDGMEEDAAGFSLL